MSVDGRRFLEDKLDETRVSRETNGYVISAIPYEETTTYVKGTRNGPQAIIDASSHIELLDDTLRIDASRFGIETLTPEITDLASITAHVSDTARSRPGALLGFLGGEHSITPAIIRGFQPKDMGIVWFDAHADLRKEYLGREDNHACAGRYSADFGPMVQIGVRSLAEEEADYLNQSSRVTCFGNWSDGVKEAIKGLPRDIYLSMDVDGFSPMLMRAVGTPEPGGLMWEETMEILDFLFEDKNVFAFDVVELCPQDTDVVSSFTAARLVYKIMAYHAYHKIRGRVPTDR